MLSVGEKIALLQLIRRILLPALLKNAKNERRYM
jgi:hypothetical protein